MRDIEAWLETTGLQAKEDHYTVPPPLPYVVFLVKENRSGADDVNKICTRSVTVELYSGAIDRESEKKIENLLTGIEYSKERTWIAESKWYQTVYQFDLIEKI